MGIVWKGMGQGYSMVMDAEREVKKGNLQRNPLY
jgi:hypothetical protein